MKEQDTRVGRREVEPQRIVKLVAGVVSMSHKIGRWNNFALVYFGNIDGGEKECGRSWEDYIIEATVTLTDAPQNKNYHLQRLVLYTQSGPPENKNAYLRKVKTLTPGNTVFLTVHTKALRKNTPGFMGEFDDDYYEEEPTGGVGYIDDPQLVRLREEIRQISRDGFTPESEVVNLEFVDVKELSTLHS